MLNVLLYSLILLQFYSIGFFQVKFATKLKSFKINNDRIIPSISPSSQSLEYSFPIVKNNDDENDEDEEDESNTETTQETTDSSESVSDSNPQISLLKQGLNTTSFLNGTDVRVGIIMARWNSDIIQGLYKVHSYITINKIVYNI
jgi:hypothetical protein